MGDARQSTVIKHLCIAITTSKNVCIAIKKNHTGGRNIVIDSKSSQDVVSFYESITGLTILTYRRVCCTRQLILGSLRENNRRG